MSEPTGTAVAKKQTWGAFLEEHKPAFQSALAEASGMKLDTLLKSFLVAANKNAKLKECTPGSVYTTIIQCAEVGLSLSPTLGQAFPVPYAGECKLILGYKGYITLMMRAGDVADVKPTVVYGNESFEIEDSVTMPKHKALPPSERGEKIKGVFITVLYKNGLKTYEWMWLEEILACRDKSPAAGKKDSPWNDPTVGFTEMCKKTVIRRLAKRMALSPSNMELLKAAAIDEGVEAGVALGDHILNAPEEEEKPLSSSVEAAEPKAEVKPEPEKKEEKRPVGCELDPNTCDWFRADKKGNCDKDNKQCTNLGKIGK